MDIEEWYLQVLETPWVQFYNFDVDIKNDYFCPDRPDSVWYVDNYEGFVSL